MNRNLLDTTDREAIRGWRLHPNAARVLIVMLVAGLAASAWLPSDMVVLKIALQLIGAFAAGMIVSKDAAIWQRIR